MSIVLNTIDQVPGAAASEGPQFTFEVGAITARDIVRARVQEEVARYNTADGPRFFVGPIAPAPAERELNAPRRTHRPALDVEHQIETALAAVRAGRVIILFNGEQVKDLDAPLPVTPVSEARFLKLVPLVGG